MKGHLKRSLGQWNTVLNNPDPVTGKRRRKWHLFKCEDEIRKRMVEERER